MPRNLVDLNGTPLPDMKLTYCVYVNLMYAVSRSEISTIGADVINSLGDKVVKVRKTLFKQMCAYMRQRNQVMFSVGPSDLISGLDKSNNIFGNNVAWQIIDDFGMPRSCGNGGDDFAQYQISQIEFFTRYRGLWDPRTEKRISRMYFSLYAGNELIINCISAMKQNDYKGARKAVTTADIAENKRRDRRL